MQDAEVLPTSTRVWISTQVSAAAGRNMQVVVPGGTLTPPVQTGKTTALSERVMKTGK